MPSSRSFGLGFSTCSVGGSTRWCNARATLIKPVTPAAALVWPIIDFTEPTTQLSGAAPSPLKTSVSAAISVSSPATVPVPCASTNPMLEAGKPACS